MTEQRDSQNDGGSESDEPSAAGSSAGSVFCTLERDYARILEEMKANEALARYEGEYTRLFETLYKCRRDEEELMERFRLLQDEVIDKTSRTYELERTIENQTDAIAKLKDEIVGALKIADAAHTREQNAQEIIENLRTSIAKLTHEIEQRNRQLALDEDSTVTKQKESLAKEKDRLTNEVETLRQRLHSMTEYTEELERKINIVDQQMNGLQESLDMQMNEISKERIIRERMEKEHQEVEEKLKNRNSQLQSANTMLKTATTNLTKLDNSLKEQKNVNDKLRKEVSKLMVGRMNLQTELDNANRLIGEMEKSLGEKTKEYKLLEHEIKGLKEEAAKYKAESSWMSSKYAKIDNARVKVEKDLEHVRHALKNAEVEVQVLRRQLADEKKITESVIREKDATTKTVRSIKETLTKMQQVIDVTEQSKRKIEMELEEAVQMLDVTTKRTQELGKEREKFTQENKNLTQKVNDYADQVRLKDLELLDYKKQMSELEIKFRQQQNLFEAVRAERNTCSKNLSISKDEIEEQREKMKLLNSQIEQLKEDISTKESDFIKGDFLLGKAEKEKETARLELQSSRKEVFDLRRQFEEAKKEEKRLRLNIKTADMDISRLKKEIDTVMNERDVLGTQLVRRNDELSLQYSKMKILHCTISRGETEYTQRIEDIRLLKLEVKKLRTEKELLAKSLKNSSDLRVEVFHLDRDLTKERLKVIALEEEVQTPMNIHRWRKLEGSDPSTLELVKKVQILQKRILKMNSELISKNEKIKEKEILCMELREILEKQPSSEFILDFEKNQKMLRERERKMKCITGELNMWEDRANEYKYELDNVAKELRDLKIKYYSLKRKNQRMKKTDGQIKETSDNSLPSLSPNHKKFCGGGFTMSIAPSRNCYSLESIRK